MKKAFMGVRLKRLREERGMSQIELARALELSPSYLNQLERNQRPLTVPVLLRLNSVFGVDVQTFSEDDEARLITDLKELFRGDRDAENISMTEIRELSANMPAVARAILSFARRERTAREREEALASKLGLSRNEITDVKPMPFEEVRDFFYQRHNHIENLDEYAETLANQWNLHKGSVAEGLEKRLWNAHKINVVRDGINNNGTNESLRNYDPYNKVLTLSATLPTSRAAFQMATQIAFLEVSPLIDEIIAETSFSSEEAKKLARIGLANYFAGALILPYQKFLEQAENLSYDIELLGRDFGVGFETTCHRLSTLQRPKARGIPFFFVRVDRAGNISKRQSATDFHFSRIGGTCPLWNVYEAFSSPNRISVQPAAMPDGRAYLWIARTVSRHFGGFHSPGKTFSIGLGCDIKHAEKLVYSKGLNLEARDSFTPIGAGCKVCPRENCPQRAFPSYGTSTIADENKRGFLPYTS